MKTSQIICFACAGLILLFVLRPNRKTPPAVNGPTNTSGGSHVISFHATNGTWKNVQSDPVPEVPTVVRYNLGSSNHVQMMDKMNMTLMELGIEAKERTVFWLVQARVAADWSKTPDSFKDAPDFAALQAVKLKQKIVRVLGTNDALTLKRVLETDLDGITVPPMADFEVREGADAVWREAEAIKNHRSNL